MIGDLIFIREDTIGGRLIRFWSRRGAPEWEPQGYNHVAILVGPGEWLSAEPSGVRRRDLGWLLRYAIGGGLMRFIGTPLGPATPPVLSRAGWLAAQYAIALAENRPYDFLGIVGFCLHRLMNVRVDWGNRWFCSELCSEAYYRAFAELGIPHSIPRPSFDMTPNDLARWCKIHGFEYIPFSLNGGYFSLFL